MEPTRQLLQFVTGHGMSLFPDAAPTKTAEARPVPLNVVVSKVTHLGPFPFSVGGGFGVFVLSPEGGPEWKLRIVGTLILPRGK